MTTTSLITEEHFTSKAGPPEQKEETSDKLNPEGARAQASGYDLLMLKKAQRAKKGVGSYLDSEFVDRNEKHENVGQTPASSTDQHADLYQRVSARILEFDWIFQARSGRMFIEELARTKTESLFEVEVIKLAVQYIWRFYFIRFVWYLMLPQAVAFCVFTVYTSYYYTETSYSSTIENSDRWLPGNIIFAVLLLIWAAGQFYLEGR